MEQRIEIINNWNLKKVIGEIENGNMKIPRFQRGYVWERSKIVKLLNSIYAQYPIGSFFIWMANKQYKNFSREIDGLNLPTDPESNLYSFILDGQQRITSLYVALRGKNLNNTDYASICFNLEKAEFQIPRLKTEKHNIPAFKLFDTKEYGAVLKEYTLYDVENDTNYSEVWSECLQVFSDYPISIIKTLKMDLEEVVDIFERINQGGKRLSLFDLVHASTWAPSFDLRDKIKEFNSEENIKSFGGIENEVFTQALALNSFGDCRNQNQLKLNHELCEKHWKQTTESIKLSMDFVKGFGVRFVTFLPYNSFLPVLQLYFYHSGNKAVKKEHKPFIENWFWTATFSQHYSSSSLTKMKEDADWIKSLISGNLTENIFGVTLTLKELSRVSMQNNSVVKNGVLCLMALNNPKDFDNGQIVILDKSNISKSNGKENHHFFPYSLKESFNTDAKGINSLLNFALISARLNREISNKFPSDYLKAYAYENNNIGEDLDSHFISTEAFNYALADDYEKFRETRGQMILNAIYSKVRVGEYADNQSLEDKDIIEENIEFELSEESE
ncbi:DUF262 domain-containing protein [Marinoscillum pacificum]|uniref:DUF262 domain-containing protein n=1 Tax=Marinoscillum pacificum TaxID=392723 RepID=UPI0021576A9C|nr:DUF262 domain-containing protein [Marinoscillum pacificum]